MISNNVVCVTIKRLDQPAHMRSLIGALASRMKYYNSWATDGTSFGVSKLKGGCAGSSESILVKIPHCRKSHVAAHFILRMRRCIVTCFHPLFLHNPLSKEYI